MLSVLLIILIVLLVLHFFVLPFLLLLFRQLSSPLRHLPGPPSPSFFMGNLAEMHNQENTNLVARWELSYGHSFVYRGFISGCRLMTTDPVAVTHILGHAYDYPKPDFVVDSLASMVGGYDGLLTVDGEQHRKQRKILTPAFSSTHIKSLAPIFWKKAQHLRDIWLSKVDTSSSPSTPTHVDALIWLARATLDVIGLAGFGYKFNSLSNSDQPENTNELANAFSIIFSTARKFRVITILQVWFPILRKFHRNNSLTRQARATMRRIGLQLIQEKRSAVINEMNEKGTIEDDGTPLGRDLLSVLIRSNMSSASAQQMSVNEVLCQISTFIAAGHETTAVALAWCLYALARDERVQHQLREALGKIGAAEGGQEGREAGRVERIDGEAEAGDDGEEDGISQTVLTEQISRCQYLDWVVRESLRVHAPVTNTMRVCTREVDEIPVSRGGTGANGDIQDGVKGTRRGGEEGEGGYVDKYGKRRWSIRVKKGDIISIPIQAINKSKELWGEDAAEFRPERWAQTPDSSRVIPGLYANTLTFLNGNPLSGNRACIGWKFALLEIKVFLYVLLRDIEFTIDPDLVIEKKVNVVTRPFVKSEPQLGNQMPLQITRARVGRDAGSSYGNSHSPI